MIESENISKKSSILTTVLLLTLGSAGIHRIYVGRYISGIFIFIVKCTYLVTDHWGYSWSLVLNLVCFAMLLFDLFGLYSSSFTDGAGKIITDEDPDFVYKDEKDRIMQIENRKLNRLLALLGAIAFYLVLWLLKKFVF